VAVYDVAGRVVATLYDAHATAGTLPVTWNGKNARGQESASGVYWIRAALGGEIVSRRLVIAR